MLKVGDKEMTVKVTKW